MSRAADVRQRVADAGGSPDQITLVAVTKGFPASVAVAAATAGMVDLGENYAQELVAKAVEMVDLFPVPPVFPPPEFPLPGPEFPPPGPEFPPPPLLPPPRVSPTRTTPVMSGCRRHR